MQDDPQQKGVGFRIRRTTVVTPLIKQRAVRACINRHLGPGRRPLARVFSGLARQEQTAAEQKTRNTRFKKRPESLQKE